MANRKYRHESGYGIVAGIRARVVRAMLLTGSRITNPYAGTDLLSDYDIELVVYWNLRLSRTMTDKPRECGDEIWSSRLFVPNSAYCSNGAALLISGLQWGRGVAE